LLLHLLLDLHSLELLRLLNPSGHGLIYFFQLLIFLLLDPLHFCLRLLLSPDLASHTLSVLRLLALHLLLSPVLEGQTLVWLAIESPKTAVGADLVKQL
jgi:hypothetical protein